MTIQVAQEDSTLGESTAYDTIWSQTEVPVQERTGLERIALADDKLWVVMSVVLIIWFGLILLLIRTDRRIERLERNFDASIVPPTTSD